MANRCARPPSRAAPCASSESDNLDVTASRPFVTLSHPGLLPTGRPRPLARAFRCIMLECSPITGECFMGNDRPSSSFSRQAQRCPTIPRARAASPPSQRQTRRSLLALRATPCAPRRKSTNLDVTASPPFCHADTPAPLHKVHPPDRNPRCAMLGYSQITGECFT